MNWGAILKALPSLLTLVLSLVTGRDKPPKRAEEILGDPDDPTDSEEAKERADKAADEKFSRSE